MKQKFFLCFLSFLLVFGVAQTQIFAATDAEASIRYEKGAVGKYDVSDLTEDEREWFSTFLKGNFLAHGWEQISSDILMNTLADQRDQLQIRLDELGYKIGREWCRANDTRKIRTSMLLKWGRDLKETAKAEPHNLPEVIQCIDQEVDQLLN